MRTALLCKSSLLISTANAVIHPRVLQSANPFADPKNDPYNPLRYITSIPLTSIALVLYLTTTLALFWNIWRRGAKYMLCMAIGGACYCLGLGLRFGLHSQPDSKGIYIGMYLFIVLSPCAFIAAEYILLGRLARELETGHFLLVKPQKLTKIFVGSDVATFLIQAAGGSMSTSLVTTTRNTGRKIFLAGLILQLVSFFFFTFLFLVWMMKVRYHAVDVWRRDVMTNKPWYRDWRALAAALTLSCLGVLIRSFFRAIENAEGWLGPLTTNEKYFYCLDSLPLFIAIVVYVPFWPGDFTRANLPSGPADRESAETKDSAPVSSAMTMSKTALSNNGHAASSHFYFQEKEPAST